MPEAETRDAVVSALHAALRRGYWRVAVRHFLLARALGARVPAHDAELCEAHLARCAQRELHRIRSDLQAWLHMVGSPQQGRRGEPAACERFVPFYAIARPRFPA